MKYLLVAMAIWMTGCSSQRFYVVRHAEKFVLTKDSAGMMVSNPPLSEPGKVRSFVLRGELQHKKISHIFSTNYTRTKSTAQPLSDTLGIPVQIYSPSKDSAAAFDARVKALKGNVLIVGHSNTVDDIANKLTGRTVVPGDLPETEYDNLFIITKKGKKWLFERRKYGYPSNP
jgi:phosphohistidine phosphatase SixA